MSMYKKFAAATAVVILSLSTLAADNASFTQTKPPVIAVADFKVCIEKSKLGKQEQAALESMKKQMETVLQEKEKKLSDASAKFNDMDYLDSLSPDAESNLRKELRALKEEFQQQHSQFYQTFSQASSMVVQKLIEAATKASEQVAKKYNIDLILNKEGCFYNAASLDVSNLLCTALDEIFDKENANADKGASTNMPAGLGR